MGPEFSLEPGCHEAALGALPLLSPLQARWPPTTLLSSEAVPPSQVLGKPCPPTQSVAPVLQGLGTCLALGLFCLAE